jgi:hypothetical protein
VNKMNRIEFHNRVFGIFWGVIGLLRCVTRKNLIVIDIICHLKCIQPCLRNSEMKD